jgi:hypothetical protein
MRYLYDKHKRELPKGAVKPKNVSSDSAESDNQEREVKFF